MPSVLLLTALCTPNMERLAERSLRYWSLYKEVVEERVVFPSRRAMLRELTPVSRIELHTLPDSVLDSLWVAYELLRRFGVAVEIERAPFVMIAKRGKRVAITPHVAEYPTRETVAHELTHIMEGASESLASLTVCLGPEEARATYTSARTPSIILLPMLAPFVHRMTRKSEENNKLWEALFGRRERKGGYLMNGETSAGIWLERAAFPLREDEARRMATFIMLSIAEKEEWQHFPEVWHILWKSFHSARSYKEALQLIWRGLKELAKRKGVVFDAPAP